VVIAPVSPDHSGCRTPTFAERAGLGQFVK